MTAARAASAAIAHSQSPRVAHSGAQWHFGSAPKVNAAPPSQNTTAPSASTVTSIESPTPGARPISGAFTFERPFAAGYELRGSGYFPYGTDANREYLLHHGIDIGNPAGTPVLAVGPGRVVYAGSDDSVIFGPSTSFYGNLVVVRHAIGLALDPLGDQAGAAAPLYTLYGHLSRVSTEAGERIDVGDILGEVGATGVALGPHLHLEFRTRPRDYEFTVNPALFLKPLPGTGTVVGQVVGANGRLLPNRPINLYRLVGAGSEWVAATVSYPDEHVNPAPGWAENFVFADVVAGTYAAVPVGRDRTPADLVTVTASAATRVTVTR